VHRAVAGFNEDHESRHHRARAAASSPAIRAVAPPAFGARPWWRRLAG
jgi:hypothetical protein